MRYDTPLAVWQELDAKRQFLLKRVERYAALTIPKILLPEGLNVESLDQSHDYQSIGAQAVNHVTNKLMIALFAPTRPFFKVQASVRAQDRAAASGIDAAALAEALAEVERKAVREFDARGQRPKLYQAMRHLLIAGNVLIHLDRKTKKIRVIGLRRFVVKRTIDGKLQKLVIRERIKFDELDRKVQAVLPSRYQPADEVDFLIMVVLNERGGYDLVQAVDDNVLPKEFDGRYTAETLPYRVLTWDLADESDYATGLVEEYAGDLEALSAMSEGVVNGGVLAAEMRVALDPTSRTTVEDYRDSVNGQALPAGKDDLTAVNLGNPEAIKTLDVVIDRYERRVARAFLMQSAVTRDAERVTAEEVRYVANELETAYGGVYSNLANIIQAPIAKWLLEGVDAKLNGTDLEVVIVTGLDGLSRNGDLENLRLALGDLAQAAQLPPELIDRIKWDALSAWVGAGRGVALSDFVMGDADYEKKLEMRRRQQVAMEAQAAAGVAAGEQIGAAEAGAPTQQ